MITETFSVTTHWTAEQYANDKSHVSIIVGKESIEVSAAKKFKGDATLYNPEDLLLSALSSCHFLSYQYVCKQAGIGLLSYECVTKGILEVDDNGAGRFTSIVLNIQMHIADPNNAATAIALHDKAHELCFIANSLKCKVNIDCKII